MLAQVATDVIQTGSTVAILAYMLNHFMKRSEKAHEEHRADIAERNKVIEDLVRQTNEALNNNTRALTIMSERHGE